MIAASLEILHQLAHENPIDLDLVDLEIPQVLKRGVAGAEIVDRQFETERFELRER